MKKYLPLLITAAVLAAPLTAWTHHSFSAEFDSAKTVMLKGKVTKVEWTNPHIWIYMDAKDQNGAATEWKCEGNSTTSLGRLGWTRNTVKPGDEISIEGFRAKNGSNTCNARAVTDSNGKRLFAGSTGPQ